jgi:hypothetical protein
MPDNVIPIFSSARGGIPNLKCAGCGGEWFNAIVTFDAYERSVSGRAVEVTCRECGERKSV